MTPRIVCIGDVHLRSGHARNAQCLASLDQVIEAGLALGPELGAWAVVGDLFDTTSTVDDRLAWLQRFLRMAAVAPVLVTRGNHDPEGDLLIYGQLATRWPVIVREQADVVTTQLATGQVATVFLVPYPDERRLVSDGVPIAEIPDRARQMLDGIFLDAAGKLEAARARGEITACFGHVNVFGAISSTGQPSGWKDVVLDAALFTRLGQCPKILGHIHNPQEIAGAVYCGSVGRNDVGEVEDKRFVVLTFGIGDEMREGATEADGWLYAVESHPIRCPAIWHVETEFVKNEPFDYTWKAGPDGEPLQAPASLKGCEVRCRVRFAKSERTFYEMAKPHILADFAECAKLSIEPVCVSDHALRAPEIATARTVREKAEAYAKVTGTVLPDAVLAKLDLLDSATPEAVEAHVQRQIDALVPPPVEEREEAAVA